MFFYLAASLCGCLLSVTCYIAELSPGAFEHC